MLKNENQYHVVSLLASKMAQPYHCPKKRQAKEKCPTPGKRMFAHAGLLVFLLALSVFISQILRYGAGQSDRFTLPKFLQE